MWLEDHFGSGSQRNERVKLAASFWNNVGAGMVIGGLAAAFFLDKPSGTWTKIAIAIAGLVLGWLCYSIASNMLTYLHTAPEDPRLKGGLGTARFTGMQKKSWSHRHWAYGTFRKTEVLRGGEEDGASEGEPLASAPALGECHRSLARRLKAPLSEEQAGPD